MHGIFSITSDNARLIEVFSTVISLYLYIGYLDKMKKTLILLVLMNNYIHLIMSN
jgi:hypothetical protein